MRLIERYSVPSRATSAEYGKSGDTAATLAQNYNYESIVEYFKSKGLASAEPEQQVAQRRECYIVGLFCTESEILDERRIGSQLH